jgi:hypothetical protein
MWLVLMAVFGFVVPNVFLLYWAAAEFTGLQAIVEDKLALAFILDTLLALVFLTVYFAQRPIGRVGWPWFVVLSFAGGLGFSLPLYYWVNTREQLTSARAHTR